jgi:hypothetical protein
MDTRYGNRTSLRRRSPLRGAENRRLARGLREGLKADREGVEPEGLERRDHPGACPPQDAPGGPLSPGEYLPAGFTKEGW